MPFFQIRLKACIVHAETPGYLFSVIFSKKGCIFTEKNIKKIKSKQQFYIRDDIKIIYNIVFIFFYFLQKFFKASRQRYRVSEKTTQLNFATTLETDQHHLSIYLSIYLISIYISIYLKHL